jgi:hypothetical protein
MFSGSSSKMFSEMKAPPPHPLPTDVSNYGMPFSLWIPDEYGDCHSSSLTSHSVISRCDKPRLVLRELKSHQE